MNVLTLFFISVLCIQIRGYLIKVPTSTTSNGVVAGGGVHIQKLLLPLFENVCEESIEPIIVRLSEDFKLDPTNGVYLKPEVIDNFQNHKVTKGLLPKGEIFTEYDSDHLDELKVIYELLYYAKDFDTFYKAACWARQNINCGLYVDAIYLAILNRRDTEKVSIPPPYEILPNYFIRKDFIIKASSLISDETATLSDWIRNEGNSYVLDVNYTCGAFDDNVDKLSYFHEDIGLNTYYFLTKLNSLPWVNSPQRNKNGEYMYHIMKQMVARYNLERYSNGLLEIDGIDWDYINDSPYDPMLIYSNGNDFNQRIAGNIDEEILTILKTIETNLPSVVAHLRDGGYSKSDILNNIMETLVTSERSYMNLALTILGVNKQVSLSPSVLEHFITSARDPIFWKLNKKIVDLVDNALQVLPSYTKNQLYFPGVEVQNIEVKKLMTTFDKFEFDVTDALKTEGEDSKFKIKISQSRLNHKPFSFKISILSLVAQKGLVKIYIGPKTMPGELIEKKNLFMLLDCFEVNLKIGSNLLNRASNEMTNIAEDLISLETIKKMVLNAEFGVDALPLKSIWSQIVFPSRLILPKGTSSGLPLHVFVFVAPYVKASMGGPRSIMELNSEAILSPGYPLDLDIEIQQLFNLPNAMVKDISIVHKSESTSYNKPMNSYNPTFNDRVWDIPDDVPNISSGSLALSTRPAFTKNKLDYKSKNQYGKKSDVINSETTISNKIDEIKINLPEENSINTSTEPENMEIVNNIFINPDMDHNTMDNNIYRPLVYEVKIKKDNVNEISSNAQKLENYDFAKTIDVKSRAKNIDTESDTDVVNNIYINRDIEFEKVIHDDKTFNDKQRTLDNVDIDKSININSDEIRRSFEVKNTNIKPHGLLTSPRKRFSNIFNIVIKPLKDDTNEKVYE